MPTNPLSSAATTPTWNPEIERRWALPEREKWVASQFNYLRASTIYGGSNEIQRNIIAKHVLGM